MRITEVTWQWFRLPVRRFSGATGAITERIGAIVRLTTDTGIEGIGEATPLPDRQTDTMAEINEDLKRIANNLAGFELNSAQSLDELPEASAAVACAVETAALDALGRAQGVSVASLLAPAIRDSVSVNAVIAEPDARLAGEAAHTARQAGFACIKLKVGMARDLDSERARVALVRESLDPEVLLRLDANGAWSPGEAVRIIRSLARYQLDLVEQPIARGDPKGMAAVRSAVNVPIAADEDVTDEAAALRLVEANAVDCLVVKLVVVGGPRAAMRIAEIAKQAGISTIITTSIESGVGVAAALHVAAAVPGQLLPSGLATGSFLAADLVTQPIEVRDGYMRIPKKPGLGIELDEAAVTRHEIPQEGRSDA